MLEQINKRINGEPKDKDVKTKDKKVNRFEWEEAIDLLSREFRLSWKEVTDMNIYKFNHLMKYLTHKFKKEHSNIKNVRRR